MSEGKVGWAEGSRAEAAQELAWLKAFEDAVRAQGVLIERREPVSLTSVVGLDVRWIYTLKHPTEDWRREQGISTLTMQMGKRVGYLLGGHAAKELLNGE